jgi:hypothetical protein
MSKEKIMNIVGKLEKASNAHAGQATQLKNIAKGMPMRNAPLKAFASPVKGKLKPCQKAAAKKKFKVYPSAYANMWASNHKC